MRQVVKVKVELVWDMHFPGWFAASGNKTQSLHLGTHSALGTQGPEQMRGVEWPGPVTQVFKGR